MHCPGVMNNRNKLPHESLRFSEPSEEVSINITWVYFDITGIQAVLKDSPDYQYSHFPGSKTQINELLSKGVTLMACPGCLKAAGKTEDDLMEGIEVADKDKFFTFTNGRILTLDY